MQDGEIFGNVKRKKTIEIDEMKNISNEIDNRKTKNITKTKSQKAPKITRKPPKTPKTRKNKQNTKENPNCEMNPKNNNN